MDVIQLILVSFITFIIGAAFLLVGYRFFMILLPIWGFFAGLWLGAQTISILFGEGFLVSVTGLVVGFIVGLILAVLSYFFYAVGVLLLGASFGYWFGAAVMYAIGFNPGFIATIVSIISALVFAALTVLLNVKKHLIVVVTSIGGAMGVIISILLIFARITIQDLQAGAAQSVRTIFADSFLWFIFWLALVAVGVAVQELTTRDYYLEVDR